MVVVMAGLWLSATANAQAPTPTPENAAKYIDATAGMTADRAVGMALEHNPEIHAAVKEVEAARALVRQAGLRANPKLTVSGAKMIGGADYTTMAEVMLPLELGGRRSARITVAERELEVREQDHINHERMLAADVRVKFGEALAAIMRLAVAEKTLAAARQTYDLIAARVTEGKAAPLEQSVFMVEVNRLASLRETAEGRVETALFELRSLTGMRPEEPMRLKGDFTGMIAALPSLTGSIDSALKQRPDLEGARSVERLAAARVEQAKSTGRFDASVFSGYQRTDSSFPVNGFDENGILTPVRDIFHMFTFGIEMDLPLRNRNQGAVAAAAFEQEAAKSRIEFGELTIRREVAAGFARYNRAARSLALLQNGVRDQANANLQVVWQTYELGSRSLIDYIGEMRRFLEIDNEVVDAELETYLANVEIMRAMNAAELRKK